MKKNAILFSLLAVGLTLCISSCKDDDDEKTTEAQQEENAIKQMDTTNKYWAVVGQLAGSDAYTEQWQEKTFEPIIGQADNGNEAVRVIMTGDIETAAMRFANLCGITIGDAAPGGQTFTPTSHTFTFHDDAIGTLTWHKGGATELATVDVDIKQMPGLSKLVYRTPDQAGENGDFKGTAYYRFGDVVSKVEDGHTDYWVCVRPAFGPEGKEDSHWISVSPLHGNYIKEFKKKGHTHYLPVNLCTNKEHMQNLAELLFAFTRPMEYGDNLMEKHKTLKYFHDFSYTKTYELNSNGFFYDVSDYWQEHNLFKTVFGVSQALMETELREAGLNLIYGSGSTDSEGDAYVKTANYIGTNYSVCYTAEPQVNVQTPNYDIRTLQDNEHSYIEMPVEKKGKLVKGKVWTVRYKTGKELCKGNTEAAKYDKRSPLTNCTDVYVYNRDIAHLDMNNLRNIEPQKSGLIFHSHYRYGDVYMDENQDRWIVLNMAGSPYERADYSELICFEGLETPPNGSRAYDLPTRDQAIRATLFLWNVYHNVVNSSIDDLLSLPFVSTSAYNMITAGGVDIRRLMQNTAPHDNKARHDTEQACVAYESGDYYDVTQHLLRFYVNQQNDKNDFVPTFWQHYPQNPSATEQFPTQFSSRYIILQDIAQLYPVLQYGEDTYVRQPLQPVSGGDGMTMREPRNDIDERAEDVTNYFYNRVMWDTFNYPGSMWREPVLFFRYAAIYDRGDSDYQQKTIDGKHTLRLVGARQWHRNDPNVEDEQYYIIQSLRLLFTCIDCDLTLDGQKFAMPHWKKAWEK